MSSVKTLAKGFGIPKIADKPNFKFTYELDQIFWGSELNSYEYFCVTQKRDRPVSEKNEHLLLSTNFGNSSSDKENFGPSELATNNQFTHPLAGLLILCRFSEFRATLEDALDTFLGSGEELPTKLHYELFVFSSFYPIKKMYNCVPISGKDNRRACEHILMPIAGKGDNAFIIKYVMASRGAEIQSSADEGLKHMMDMSIDRILLRNNKHVKTVFNVCISFFISKVGLAYKQVVRNRNEEDI